MNNNYIFVYGSLMNPVSRFKTLNRDVNEYDCFLLPNSGYKLSWCFRSIKWKMTALGLYRKKTERKTIGKLIKVNQLDISNLDIRERGYSRVKLDRKCIELVDKNNNIDGDIFTYVVDNPLFPNADYKIRIGYVRICCQISNSLFSCNPKVYG